MALKWAQCYHRKSFALMAFRCRLKYYWEQGTISETLAKLYVGPGYFTSKRRNADIKNGGDDAGPCCPEKETILDTDINIPALQSGVYPLFDDTIDAGENIINTAKKICTAPELSLDMSMSLSSERKDWDEDKWDNDIANFSDEILKGDSILEDENTIEPSTEISMASVSKRETFEADAPLKRFKSECLENEGKQCSSVIAEGLEYNKADSLSEQCTILEAISISQIDSEPGLAEPLKPNKDGDSEDECNVKQQSILESEVKCVLEEDACTSGGNGTVDGEFIKNSVITVSKEDEDAKENSFIAHKKSTVRSADDNNMEMPFCEPIKNILYSLELLSGSDVNGDILKCFSQCLECSCSFHRLFFWCLKRINEMAKQHVPDFMGKFYEILFAGDDLACESRNVELPVVGSPFCIEEYLKDIKHSVGDELARICKLYRQALDQELKEKEKRILDGLGALVTRGNAYCDKLCEINEKALVVLTQIDGIVEDNFCKVKASETENADLKTLLAESQAREVSAQEAIKDLTETARLKSIYISDLEAQLEEGQRLNKFYEDQLLESDRLVKSLREERTRCSADAVAEMARIRKVHLKETALLKLKIEELMLQLEDK